MDKNNSNDNYNLLYSDTMIITTTFAPASLYDLLTVINFTVTIVVSFLYHSVQFFFVHFFPQFNHDVTQLVRRQTTTAVDINAMKGFHVFSDRRIYFGGVGRGIINCIVTVTKKKRRRSNVAEIDRIV